MVIFHSYVSVPEGMSLILNPFDTGLSPGGPHSMTWGHGFKLVEHQGWEVRRWDEAGRDEASFKLVSVLFFPTNICIPSGYLT